MNSQPSVPRGPRFRSPGLFCALLALALALTGLTGRAANTASNTIVSLQAQINQLEAQIESSGKITQAQQDQLDSLLSQLEVSRKQANDALNDLDKLINDANNTQGGTIINDPNLDPVPDPMSPAVALAELQAAIGRGDSAAVAAVLASKAGPLATALADPANARAVAGALLALKTGTVADAVNAAKIAGSLATLAGSLPTTAAQSASVLVSAVSTVISKPEVISAAPQLVATIKATVLPLPGSTTNQQPLDVSTVSRSS